jgi:large subunit ribosomal protein L24
VEGVNMATKHKKPRKQGEVGGIIKQETPIYASKVMNVCPKCGKPTRLAHEVLENGEKVRVCKHCSETI